MASTSVVKKFGNVNGERTAVYVVGKEESDAAKVVIALPYNEPDHRGQCACASAVAVVQVGFLKEPAVAGC